MIFFYYLRAYFETLLSRKSYNKMMKYL